MGDWYEIGVAIGLGVAAGVLLAGVLAAWKYGLLLSVVGALAVGVVAGLLLKGWLGLPGGLLGGVVGALSASVIARGALRRGGAPGGTAFLLVSAAIVLGLLALVPAVGYVIVVALPLLAVRRARQAPERYAGLRTLAK